MAKISSFLAIFVLVQLAAVATGNQAAGEPIPFKSIITKLQAIHEDAKSLLIKNAELKAKILVGLQAQNEAKLKSAKEAKLKSSAVQVQPNQYVPPQQIQTPKPPDVNQQQQQQNNKDLDIDYSELEEFNKWVEVNLDYATKNTQASIETLKEEAAQNNGSVDYSDQAIKDGIEGVKYWQSAVIFQDKTLKNEKFEVD